MISNFEAAIILLYAFPSLILYVSVIFMLVLKFRKKQFSSPFYKLFVINGILDMYKWTMVYFNSRVSTVSWFYWYYKLIPSSGFVPTIIVWLSYYATYAEMTTYIFMTFNRFTAITWHLNNQQIWHRLFPISIAIIFLIPFPFTWHMLVAGCYIIPRDDHNPPLYGYRLDANTVFNIQNSWFVTAFTFIAGFSGLIMNSWMIISLFSRRKSKDARKAGTNTKGGETKLFIFSLLVFLTFSLSFVIHIIFVLIPNMSNDMYITIMEFEFYSSDIFLLTPPWFLLILSKTIRKEYFKMLGISKSKIFFVQPIII